jgi:hypothetical protein
MATGEEIVITIDKLGRSKLEGNNFQGEGCKAATAPFEQILGKVESTQLKPEYYDQPQGEAERLKQGGAF